MQTVVETRSFSEADQRDFARLSGDRNPMHLDPIAARRTLAGAPVVHGINGLLWAMDALTKQGILDRIPSSINIRFRSFLHLEIPVALHVSYTDKTVLGADLIVNGLPVTSLQIRFDENFNTREMPQLPLLEIGSSAGPLSPAFDELSQTRGWLQPPLPPQETIARYPDLCRLMDVHRVDAMVQLSTVVGMACPGLHSVFSVAVIRFPQLPADSRRGAGFRVERADARHRLVRMIAQGSGIDADLTAFMRPEPQDGPSMEAARAKVEKREFSHCSALVVGGSRGLGAATAKLLAAGGAKVVITYAKGAVDAQSVCEDIVHNGGSGTCAMLQLDVTNEIPSQLANLPMGITHLFYFPTPQIFRATKQVFDAELFRDFSSYYISGFAGIAEWLIARDDAKLRGIFYPSSVAVEERPAGMTCYAMSKAAGELLCADIARSWPHLRIVVHRLPRIATDQTATLANVEAASPIDAMLPLVRRTVLDDN